MAPFRLILLFSLITLALHGQRSCGSHEIFQEELSSNPDFRNFQKNFNKIVTRNSRSVEGVITIPVVVHVIYNTTAENISDEQVFSQLEVINEDFRRMNSDADGIWQQAADSEIEFCLARRDPYGDATCGITRTYSDSTKYFTKTTMKNEMTGGKSNWPSDQYLNIWVCDLSGRLGFATFPGGDESIDGIVVDTRAFGTIGDLKSDFALGRTTTHEIGHWLNLRHIWGDGDCFDDDFVSDTPISDDHNYGCEVGHISCGSVDMVQNYMDYSDDVCMNLFTQGQKNRMRALFGPSGFRASLLNSPACLEPTTCNAIFLAINFDDYPGDISWTIKDQNAGLIASGGNYLNATWANQTYNQTICIEDGTYEFEISDSYGDGLCCNEGSGSYSITNTYRDLHLGDGRFFSEETITFVANDSKYRFVGPGTDWQEANNWNKLDPPSDCYDGPIYIESDCETNGEFILESSNSIIVRTGAEFKIK